MQQVQVQCLNLFKVYQGRLPLNILLLGCLSAPVSQAAVIDHEPNNTQQTAVYLNVGGGIKTYQFDYQGDQDWFAFYARKGQPYEVKIPDKSVGKGVNPVLEIFNSTGGLESSAFDLNCYGQGETLSGLRFAADGFYFVRVTNQKTSFCNSDPKTTYNGDAYYDLQVYEPTLPNNLVVKGKVSDQCTQKGLNEAAVESSADATLTAPSGEYGLQFPPGSYTLTASFPGYVSQSKSVSLREDIDPEDYELVTTDFVLSPDGACPIPPPSKPKASVAVFDDVSGELRIDDVRVGTGRVSAKLVKQAGWDFKLLDAPSLSGDHYLIDNNGQAIDPAYYDFIKKIADIPSVTAYGKHYKIRLINSGGAIYSLQLNDIKEVD